MIPGKFEYFAPTSVSEAIGLLGQYGSEAKILAGGQSLIPAMRFRLAQPEILVDINRIQGLEYVRETDDYLEIGALTRESAIEKSTIVQQRYPMLADTARVIADPLVRNMATIGGNLAHADPANDHPATILAYNARIVAEGPGGERIIPVDDFFIGIFETSLERDEILKEILIPSPPGGSGGAYLKIERKVGDYAVVGVAVQLTMEDGLFKSIRIGLTNVSSTPMRARAAEALLVGQTPEEALFDKAGRVAAAECEPWADLRGSEEYKRDLVRVVTKRAIRKAIERANGVL
ncbi:MAG: Carbon monoxide dehydrogenase [Chloroflexi bacterium]|jgi:carbon-monoxide dehydrogenase medium subunit|nr:Carbon monoxide dehydrogenase [Chloroflexota bacterium]